MNTEVERSRSFSDLLESKGRFPLTHYRKSKAGLYLPIAELDFSNGVTDAGKTYLLEAGFNAGTQASSWFLGLIAGATTPVLANSDTSASHTGWSEFLSYTESVRQTWTKGTTAGNTVTGSSASIFTIGTVATNTFVTGGFLISNNTKAGTTGILWSTGLFTNPVPVQATDIFKLGYLTGL